MTCSRITRVLAVAGLAGCAAAVSADVVAARPLGLRTGMVDLSLEPDALRDNASKAWSAPAAVMSLSRPIGRAEREALGLLRVGILDALAPDALVVDLRNADRAALARADFVAGLHPFAGAWKATPEVRDPSQLDPLRFSDERRKDLARQGKLAGMIACFPGVPQADALAALRAVPGVTAIKASSASGQTLIQATFAPAALEALAALEIVQAIEPVPEFTTRSNATTRWVVQSNTPNATPLYNRGITGAGQIIGIIDDGLAPDHCSFLDAVNLPGPTHRKIVALNSGVYNPHGLHVACTAAGDDGRFSNNKGIAYGAKIAFNTFPNFGEQFVYDRFDLHRTQGAFIHNNSWGNAGTRAYDSTCRAIDRFSREHEDNLVLFAVADALVTLNPENAKNCLAVSLSSNAPIQQNPCVNGLGQVQGPSSPTTDGRRKPEVVAPGCGIVSATGESGCSTTSFIGTSMSTPAVAGVATLFRQYYTEGFYPTGVATPSDAFVPSGALLRASVVNTAVDLTGEAGFPSEREGWGRVLADESAYFPGDARTLLVRDIRNNAPEALDTGDVFEMRVDVNSAAQPLKVTLAFTDVPAAINAVNAAINNIDLEVQTQAGPPGQVYYGNAFAGGQSITQAQGGTPDAINSVEQVLINSPAAPATWVIRVRAVNVPMGPQGFALVVTGGVSVPVCNAIDFNGDGVYPDTCDIVDWLSVFAGGPCCVCNDCDVNACDDIDFNNDGIFPALEDLDAFLRVFSGGGC
jgi:subtilisin family serine protease